MGKPSGQWTPEDDEMGTGEIKVAGVIMVSAALDDLAKEVQRLAWMTERLVAVQTEALAETRRGRWPWSGQRR